MEMELYFVNNINNLFNKKESIVTLFKVSDDNYVKSEDIYINEEKIINIEEGSFVYIDSKDQFISAGSNKIAKRQIFTNNMLRGKLITKYASPNNINLKKTDEVYSYHINVGHGNCSIIVFSYNSTYKIWVVDCSEFDFRKRVSYRQNINKCFQFIKNKFELNDVKIDKLFVTHPHYDHFNGINYLISQNYLTNTEVWINLYYSWPDSNYNKLLQNLRKLNLTLIEPKVSNGNGIIEILYPNETILRTHPKNVQSYPRYSIVPVKKINNSSAIFKINLAGKSMVFPGDIEEDGWNNVKCCYPHLKNATFYCISHHGSITGYKRNNCPQKCSINDIQFCCSDKRINILMGRNNAYPGIFNQSVLDSFKGRIYRTDLSDSNEEPCFIELNWKNSEIKYYNDKQVLDEVAATKEDQ
ncbi:MBL fold metallo-hydrolase [Clostridium sp. JN-1]|uniref:MBL fold metallo-hydrolase n=1 Tax=Clostridium sp. JN-1 TaxID=2483110 RepID=UPI000F0B88EE|nr:MBL fold metallo-hydrolase [Clostridium sp. JN-1]